MGDILTSMIDNIFGADFIQSAIDSINIGVASEYGTVLDYIQDDKVQSVICAIAAVLLTMHLLIELMEKMTNDTFTSDQFIKLLIKFVFGMVIISHGTEWSLQFMNIGAKFINDIMDAINVTTITVTKPEDSGFWEAIGAMVILAIPLLVSFLLRVAIFFISFSRIIEMILRAMFAPIGCADVVSGGSHSAGVRYLKKMLAISIQGALMIAVVYISSEMLSGVMQNLVTNGLGITDIMGLGQYFGITAAMVGLLGATKSIANEVVGV